ncbi:protein of unknown function [Kyrpidia spormannii]|uniref:Uncharacterized protein n=1 Tax=Kyrpidia spormannii TaxID=2055160 RepID=A0A6F9E818_9BACL|nr:protein of unknown function [Kyrpidia spormannii]
MRVAGGGGLPPAPPLCQAVVDVLFAELKDRGKPAVALGPDVRSQFLDARDGAVDPGEHNLGRMRRQAEELLFPLVNDENPEPSP